MEVTDAGYMFSVCTLNLWKQHRFAERQAALHDFLQLSFPDILAVQELSTETFRYIQEAAPGYSCIQDPFPGWQQEGNIFWNKQIFDLKRYGAEEIGQLEKDRRLFWTELLVRASKQKLFIFNVHLTCCAVAEEKQTGVNLRIKQAERCLNVVDRLVPDYLNPVIFMGDLNEDEHPLWKFQEIGLASIHQQLKRFPQPTSPAIPLPGKIPAVDDWILSRGDILPCAIDLVECAAAELTISDHRPLMAIFRI